MPDIRFETGLVAYDLNGACQVCFNPTDNGFVERLFQAFEQLEKLQQEHEREVGHVEDFSAFFQHSRERDKGIREVLDSLFGAPVCQAVFGPMNLYALADGLPVWCNLILSVMDEVDTSFAREQKRSNARLAKYTAKYHKK